MASRVNIIVGFSILLLLVVNIVFLDFAAFMPKTDSAASVEVTPTPTPLLDIPCGTKCQDLVDRKINEALLAQNNSGADARQDTVPVRAPKEFVISLGSGMTRNNEWEAIPGAEVYIDTDKYQKIRTVIFESSMYIPTANGRMYAKIFNATDKHDVWFSEMSMEGNTVIRPQATVSLDKGNKLYRLMAKSSLKYDALILNAVIRVITDE